MFKHRKIISLLMCIVMVFTLVPISVSSAGTGEVLNTGQTDEQATEQASDEYTLIDSVETVHDEIIGNVVEIEDLREENVKHFRLNDGSYQAVSYGAPVHRQNSAGEWVDINNNLSAVLDKYTTQDNRMQFAQDYSPNTRLFTLTEGEYSISMTHMVQSNSGNLGNMTETEMQPIAASVQNSPNAVRPTYFDSIEAARAIDNKSSIVYENIRLNTDLEYVLYGNDIKENIILDGLSDSYDYVFRLDLTGLTATLTAGGDIALFDTETGEQKYSIPRPYMYDADGVLSYDVQYALQEAPGGKYLLAISADEAWIEHPDRSFPVVIDPTLNVANTSYMQDTYTNINQGSMIYGAQYALSIGKDTDAYFYINVPSLPENATFTSGYMRFYYYMYSGGMTVDAYKVTSSWNEATLTYSNAPSHNATSFANVTLTGDPSCSPSLPIVANIDLTLVLGEWIDDSTTNYGIVMKRTSSTNETDSANIHSREASNLNFGDLNYYLYTECVIISYVETLSDGVYSFRSIRAAKYMTYAQNGFDTGYNLTWERISTPTDEDSPNRDGLFKVTRVGDTDRYIIRSMKNNRLSFKISGDYIESITIPANDADVNTTDTFQIYQTGSYYIIKPYGSSYAFSVPNDSSNLLTHSSASDITSNNYWAVTQYTGAHISGSSGEYPAEWSSKGHIVGTMGRVEYIGWSTYTHANTVNAYVRQGEEDMCNFTQLGNNSLYAIRANLPGELHVDVNMLNSSGSAVASCGSYAYRIVPDEGTYYIRNENTRKYIDIPIDLSNNDTTLQQWKFVTANSIKWDIEHVPNSNGYIRLKSHYSGLYARVDPNNASSITQSTIQDDYSLWKIDRTANKNLKFICKATESTNHVLAVPLNATNDDGVKLTQIVYTADLNYRDEWTLHLDQVTAHVNLEVNLDNGYLIRYPDAYNKIIRETNALKEKFLVEFGLEINISYISLISSLPDLECNTSPYAACNCTTNQNCYNSGFSTQYNLHHKNTYNMLLNSSAISVPNMSSSFKMVYFGHDNCRVNRDNNGNYISHVTNPVYGFCYPSRGIISINNFSSEASSTKTVVHEFGHIYNAPDHYTLGETAELNRLHGRGFDDDCIYGMYKGDALTMNNLTICEGCKSFIRENINNYNHEEE